MRSSPLDPNDFCRPGTRRIRAFGSSARSLVVAGAGWDGHVYLWNLATRERLRDFPTIFDNGGVSVAVDATGSSCFAGTYYAWGVACIGVADGRERWRRSACRIRHAPDGPEENSGW